MPNVDKHNSTNLVLLKIKHGSGGASTVDTPKEVRDTKQHKKKLICSKVIVVSAKIIFVGWHPESLGTVKIAGTEATEERVGSLRRNRLVATPWNPNYFGLEPTWTLRIEPV